MAKITVEKTEISIRIFRYLGKVVAPNFFAEPLTRDWLIYTLKVTFLIEETTISKEEFH
jgi:hypothetical protein